MRRGYELKVILSSLSESTKKSSKHTSECKKRKIQDKQSLNFKKHWGCLYADYLSDALLAQVDGLGLVAGANVDDNITVFEATHGQLPNILV
jgi:isocitrate dehydrogenase